MNNSKQLYIIEIKNINSDNKYVGWSMSSDDLGFYYTNIKCCKIFDIYTIKSDESLKDFLSKTDYALIAVDDSYHYRQSQIYSI